MTVVCSQSLSDVTVMTQVIFILIRKSVRMRPSSGNCNHMSQTLLGCNQPGTQVLSLWSPSGITAFLREAAVRIQGASRVSDLPINICCRQIIGVTGQVPKSTAQIIIILKLYVYIWRSAQNSCSFLQHRISKSSEPHQIWIESRWGRSEKNLSPLTKASFGFQSVEGLCRRRYL